MAQVQITAVMPTYRHAEYLRQAIFSIQNQPIPVQIVVVPVVEDKASMHAAYTLRNRDPTIRVALSKKADVFHQMQIGLEQVHTKYFFVFGSDDYMLPSMLEVCLDEAKKVENPIVAPSYAITDERLNITSFHINKPFQLAKQMKASYISDIALVRADSAKSVGGFTGDRDWGYLSHFAFYHRLLKRGDCQVKLLKDIGFLYRQLPKSRHVERYKDAKTIREHRARMRDIGRYYWEST